jgi:hypothetical protein
MISILFLDETAWEILYLVSSVSVYIEQFDVLSGVGLVVHEEKVNITGVVDEESLVAGWHHVASSLVGTETDLCERAISASTLPALMLLASTKVGLNCGLPSFHPSSGNVWYIQMA